MSLPAAQTGVKEVVVTRPDDETTMGESRLAHFVNVTAMLREKAGEERFYDTPLKAFRGMVFGPSAQSDPAPTCPV